MNLHCVHFVSNSTLRLLCLTTKDLIFFHVFLARRILCVLVKAWGSFKPMLHFFNKCKEVATSQQGKLSLFSCFLAKKMCMFFFQWGGRSLFLCLFGKVLCVCASVFFFVEGKIGCCKERERKVVGVVSILCLCVVCRGRKKSC
jgi:hypothetical protein